jgi:hypothetical protein
MNPKISIIMPCLNAVSFIEKSIESVINQTFKDIEIICVDAGSTDGTYDILEQYSKKDSRIKLIQIDIKSYGFQLNIGLGMANGDYIGIVESDDFIEADMFEILYGLTEDGTIDIAKINFSHYDTNLEHKFLVDTSKGILPNTPFTVDEYPNILFGHPSIWSAIYKKSFLDENNILFKEADGGGWVDHPFFLKVMLSAKSIKYKNEPSYYHRELDCNSSINTLDNLSAPMYRMIDNLDILEEYSFTDEKIIENVYAHIFWYMRDILNHELYVKQEQKVLISFQGVLRRMDFKFIEEHFDLNTQKLYKKYCSPVNLINLNKTNLSKEDYDDLVNENIFLTSQISTFEKNNNKLNSQIKKLNSENKKLNNKIKKANKSLKTIKGSKAYKIGSISAVPVRKYKKSKYDKEYSKRMRILFIPSDNNRTSGAFLCMASMIDILKDKYPIDPFVILPNPGEGVEVLDSLNIDYTLIQSRDWVIPMSLRKDEKYYKDIKNKRSINKKAVKRIRKFIKDHDIDLLHINTTYSYVGALAAMDEDIPFVWHLREFLEEGQNLTLWDREKGNALINKANKVITVSKVLNKKYEGIIDDDKLISIYDGIDANRFYNPNKEIFEYDIIKFIFVGGFEYHKGQIHFAKACVKLYNSGFQGFKVSFIGTGTPKVRKEVEDIFKEGNLKNVEYLGYKLDVENYFKESDISFTCGSIESFGRTTVEAMLSGNLVIGANTAGTHELLAGGEIGILYEYGDVDDLYEKMLLAIHNREKSKKIAQKGRKYMFDNMTAEINADNVYKVYKEILNK